MNTYLFFFNDKRVEIEAVSLYAAKLSAIAHFKPAKSKQHMVHGAVVETNGLKVTHSTASID
jgi:hypothetical protein